MLSLSTTLDVMNIQLLHFQLLPAHTLFFSSSCIHTKSKVIWYDNKKALQSATLYLRAWAVISLSLEFGISFFLTFSAILRVSRNWPVVKR